MAKEVAKKIAKAAKRGKGKSGKGKGGKGGVGTPAGGFAFANPKHSPDNFITFTPDEIRADKGVTETTSILAFRGPRKSPPVMALDEVLGAAAVTQIKNAGSITIHTVGDTGGIHQPENQFAVADAMAADLGGKTYASGLPAFFYHLGDIVYYLGQDRYYYEQFYDPYRDYDAPIFAIPGNHDGTTSPSLPNQQSLDGFWNNFCSDVPRHHPDAHGYLRTTMTQPGAYFTLDAPFVKIIGLYSNVAEKNYQGTISGSVVGPGQLNFLRQQLTLAAQQRANGDRRALLIAVHHPPFTSSPDHTPNPMMLDDIDNALQAANIQPDMVLSGHAHLYERFTRFVGANQIPFVVAGCGGFYNLAGIKQPNEPQPALGTTGIDGNGNRVRFEKFKDRTFGFLRLTISAAQIKGEFIGVDVQSRQLSSEDRFTVNLQNHTVSSP
jgi:Calcineurin-like phosphoesterase